jgi:hypothetical protein
MRDIAAERCMRDIVQNVIRKSLQEIIHPLAYQSAGVEARRLAK